MSKKIEILYIRLKKYIRKLNRIEKTWYILLVLVIILLIVPLFRFTILDHDFYKTVANKQQKMIERNPSARGTIHSSNESTSGIVAVSTNLGTLAIDPTQTGSTVELLNFLSDAVMTEFCLHKNTNDCRESISSYIRADEPLNATTSRDDMKKYVTNYLESRIKTPVESVFIAENLPDATINKINSLSSEALFFVVNNLYINPTKVQSKDLLADRLARILNIPKDTLLKKMEIRPKRHLEIIRSMSVASRSFVDAYIKSNEELIKKLVGDATADKKKKSTDVKPKIIEEHGVYPFIKIEDNFIRYYPEGETLGQITGFVDSEGVGRYGIE